MQARYDDLCSVNKEYEHDYTSEEEIYYSDADDCDMEEFAHEIEAALETECEGEKTEKSLPNGRLSYFGSYPGVMSSDYATVQAEAEVKRIEQQLRDTLPCRREKRRALEFSRCAIVEFMLLAFGIHIPIAQAVSSAEEYSNACSTLIWTIACCFVLWKFGDAVCKLIGSFVLLVGSLTSAVNLLSNQFALLLKTINSSIPLMINEVKSYLWWMKMATAVNAGCALFSVVLTVLKIPFNAFNFFRVGPCGFVHESKQGMQKFNKYGTLISAVLAAFIFLAAPLYGFAKAYKMFDPIKRCLENLPYVTWLVDWIVGVCEGTAGANDIPASVRGFQSGVEIPVGTGGYMYATGRDPDGKPTCDVGMCKRHENCDDNSCFCRCHIGEEEQEAADAVASDDPREGTAGLGSKAQAVLRRNQMTFVKSMEEPRESRIARLEVLAEDTADMIARAEDLERAHKFALFEKAQKEAEDKKKLNLEANLEFMRNTLINSSKDKVEEPPPLVLDEIIHEKKQGKCPHCESQLIETEKERCICCGGLLSEVRPEPTVLAVVPPVLKETVLQNWCRLIYSGVEGAYNGRVKPVVEPVLSHVQRNKTWYIGGFVTLVGVCAAIACDE